MLKDIKYRYLNFKGEISYMKGRWKSLKWSFWKQIPSLLCSLLVEYFFSLMSEFIGEELCLTSMVAANYREPCFWSWENFFLSVFFWFWVSSLYKQVPWFTQRNYKFCPHPFFCLPAEKFLSPLAWSVVCGARPLWPDLWLNDQSNFFLAVLLCHF